MTTKQWIRTTTRDRIYRRDGYRCVWCSTQVFVSQDQTPCMATLDHVVPRADGGSNMPSNLITCCHRCNSIRADMSAESFAFALASRLYVNPNNAWEDTVAIIARVCRAIGTDLPK